MLLDCWTQNQSPENKIDYSALQTSHECIKAIPSTNRSKWNNKFAMLVTRIKQALGFLHRLTWASFSVVWRIWDIYVRRQNPKSQTSLTWSVKLLSLANIVIASGRNAGQLPGAGGYRFSRGVPWCSPQGSKTRQKGLTLPPPQILVHKQIFKGLEW